MMTPKCVCGDDVHFRRGEKTVQCHCGVPCTRDKVGYWSKGLFTILFTPKDKFLAKNARYANAN